MKYATCEYVHKHYCVQVFLITNTYAKQFTFTRAFLTF